MPGDVKLTAPQRRVLAQIAAVPDSRRHLVGAWAFGTRTCAALYRRGLIDAACDPSHARRYDDVSVAINEAGRRVLQGDPK